MNRPIIYAAGIAMLWKDINNSVERYQYSLRAGLDTTDEEESLVEDWEALREALLHADATPR